MQKILKRLILLLLIAVIALAVVACSPDKDKDNVPSGGEVVNPDDGQSTINKSVIFADIKNGLLNAGNRIDQMNVGTLHVTSEYTLRVNNVNLGVNYEANYNLARHEDSEIMLNVYNYALEQTTAFVYYKDNNLYYNVGGKRVKIDKFGTTSSFALFFETITVFDLKTVFYSSSFAENIETMSTAAETNKIIRFNLDSEKENITVSDVNLDRLKGVVNEFITSNITSLGTRLDALSNMLLGFDFSELGKVEIGLFNAQKLMTVLTKVNESTSYVNHFEITFAGMQSNNVRDYYFKALYATEEEYVAIKPPRAVDPAVNSDYVNESYGEVHMAGTLEVPYLGAEFYLDMRGDFNTLDNSANKFAVKMYERPFTGEAAIDDLIKVIATSHYTDGTLYADLTEFIKIYFGNVVDFPALGLPKVKFENIDLAHEFRKLIEEAIDVVSSGIDLDFSGITDGNDRLRSLIGKVRSENGVFYVTIDSEFVSGVLGSSADSIVNYLSSLLGVDSKYIKDIMSLGVADGLKAEISFDTLSRDLGITLTNHDELILRGSFNVYSVTASGLEIDIPASSELADYGNFIVPETVSVKIEGSFGAQGNEKNDISPLMGALIGDVSGKNTPCFLGVTDTLGISGYIYETNGETFVTLTLTINGEVCAVINSDPEDFGTLYIDNRMLGIKYIIKRDIVLRSLQKMTEDMGVSGNWNTEAIAAVYAAIVNYGSVRIENDKIVVSLAAGSGNGSGNILLQLLGVEAFSGTVSMSADFAAPAVNFDKSEYSVPAIGVYDHNADSVVTEAVWESIYSAVWYNAAAVSVGDKVLIMELTYTEESSNLVTGVYEYHPTAKLFGQIVTYSVYFTDNVNGTSVVSALVDYTMVVDPSDEEPFAPTVAVIYSNGRYGALPYIIEYKDGSPFAYGNDNAESLLNGVAPDTYRLVLGKGSIAEASFDITLTVLGRTIKVASDSDYYNDIPIVARVSVDPYEYSLLKMKTEAAGGRYYPIRYRSDDPATPDFDESSALYLTFNSYIGSDNTETIKLPEFDWGFDEKVITAKGGEYVVLAKYKRLDIAMVVTVLAKEVDYVQINDENPRYYTVDSLISSTYTIPTSTNAENEVRIYFKSGKYRIVGNAPAGYVKTDPLCDGYYDLPLEWRYGVADYVTLDRSVNPLNNGRDNTTTAMFGDDIVGKQEVLLNVVCPTRIIDYRSESVVAVTSVVYGDDGAVLYESCVKKPTRASQVSFTQYGSTQDSYFYFDPYSNAESNIYLPKKIYADVIYRGKTIRRAYPVTWLTGLDGVNDNIISADGQILNAFADETYLKVYGRIGDGELTEVLTLLVFNRSGSYENVVMRNADDSLFQGVTVYRYDEHGTRIPDGDNTTPVALKRYYIEHLNPYDALVLPARITLEFSEESGIPDSTYTANWLTADDLEVSEFTPSPVGAVYVVHTGIKSEADSGMLDQIIELHLSFDTQKVVTDRIYGLIPAADEANIRVYETASGDKIPYVEINTYSLASYELYSSLCAGVNKVGIGFLDGSASSGVPITWTNLDEFLSTLTSPLGSSAYYHPGMYEGDIIVLRGVIKKDTPLEQNVGLGFKVSARVLTGMNFNNLSDEFTTPDSDGIIPVDMTMDMVRYNVKDGALVTSGSNSIVIRFNKFYALRGAYTDEAGITMNGLCTPSQYIKYIFGSVSLSFADSATINALHYTLRDDFDQIVYGNVFPSDPDVTMSGPETTIRMKIDKLTEGSCVRSFNVTLIFRHDFLAESDYATGVETFDENGNPLFETQEGYVLPEKFTVEYTRSGAVEYDNLVWHAENTENGMYGVMLTAGQIVKNIRYEFFRFTTGRNITLYADLPGGQRITWRLHFYGKNVNYINYNTDGDDLYKVVNGTLTISNVYDVMPVDNIFNRIATTIRPSSTMQFEAPYAISFELFDGWHPAEMFADDNGYFSADILRQSITSEGLPKQLFAFGYVRGYNGEKQRINLYIQVMELESGMITHSDYEIIANSLRFDQYANDDYDGTFVLPKDIKVTFGDVFHQFGKNDNVKYELRSAASPYTYTEVTELTYNNIGHTMGANYGGVNDELFLRVTLTDGNNSLNFRVTFPDRRVSSVAYSIKSNTGVANTYVTGKYYIDPYDSETFTLPAFAKFYFGSETQGVIHKVAWTPVSGAENAFIAENGGYKYKGGDYGGATYEFETILRSFDDNDEEQTVTMTVIVLNRTALQMPAALGTSGSYKITLPFTTYVSDIPYIIPAENFAALTDPLYADYLAVSAPVIPTVKWYKVADAVSGTYTPFVNDDIKTLGGFTTPVIGVLEFGEGEALSRGQTFNMTFTADTWEFYEISGIESYLIELNPFTMASIAQSFNVVFLVRGVGTSFETLTFYPEYYADNAAKRRSVMIFNKSDLTSREKASVTFACEGKNASENRITTQEIYSLDAQQIGIDEISFGFGSGFAVSGLVELVIDPLNPVIPDKALARGKILNGRDEIIALDEVDIVWNSDIYDMSLAGGTKAVPATASKAGITSEITVRVTYLNRTPETILTTESGFTVSANPVGGYYTLMATTMNSSGNLTRNHYMTVDPINSDIFKAEGKTNVYYNVAVGDPEMSKYTLPKTLRVQFANDYDIGTTVYEAVNALGESLELIDVEWRISRNVSLVGTSVNGNPITASIRRFRVRYEHNGIEYVSKLYDYFEEPGILGTAFNLLLTTVNRQVVSTSISGVPENSTIDYQRAFDQYYIDPYDIKFPESIAVTYTGAAIDEVYTDIEWTYDEKYLMRSDVISGNIDSNVDVLNHPEDSKMFIMGTMQVYGTELSIQFKIKARKINITVITAAGETSQPLSGGTLYVRKGVPLEEQLPDHLYYRFDYADNTSQVAAVPLKIATGNINNIDNVEAGTTYTGVSGTLGKVDNDNITFTIIVIDPKLYIVNEEVSLVAGAANKYTNGGFYYDYIPVGVNRAGQYVPGPETALLPDKVIVSEDGAYMNIIDVKYNVQDMVAEFRCNYTFLSFSDSPNLSGDAEGNGDNSDKMELIFTVPIRTYDYTAIEARTVEFAVDTVRFPIGHTITSSDMPATVAGIQPLWSFDNLNQNRAGEYLATCTFKNAYGEILTGHITVIFEKQSITQDDITWVTVNDVNFLNRVYTGAPLNVYNFIEMAKFLRSDGKMGALERFSVQYSIDGGLSWQDEQPLAVKMDGAPDYRVRIAVREGDDYNVTGSVVYRLTINKCEIYEEEIYFHKGDDVPVKEITAAYTGREITPMIGGVPEGATYELVYAYYDPQNTNPAYNRVIRPINVGDYIMRMTFSVDQRNYTIDFGLAFTAIIHVVKPDIGASLKVKETMEYNGLYRDAIVEGIPEGAGDIRMEFSYVNLDTNTPLATGAQIREAGNYRVTVRLYGGSNWPSYNTGETGALVNQRLIDQVVTITRRQVVISVGTVESEYLAPLKAMNSSVSVAYALNPDEKGLVGTDSLEILGELDVRWIGGELTYKHMVGSYPISFVRNPSHRNYEFVEVNGGYYNIVARMQGAIIINNADELRAAVGALTNGGTVRWYLRAGNYGDLVIDKNASVAIVGSYNLSATEEEIAVYFNSVVVHAGDVTLDIVAFNAAASASSLYVGRAAGSVTVSRSEFKRAATNTLVDSIGIRVQYGYSEILEIKESYFYGYKTAVYVESGALNVLDTEFYMNDTGVNLGSGELTLNNNSFRNTRGPAVYVAATDAKLSIFDNTFRNNNVAISTNTALRNDIRVQNVFRDNAETFLGWEE